MEENLKETIKTETIKTINEFADSFAKEQRKNIKLGMALQRLKDDYYFDRIVACIKGDLKDTYGVFEKLKPLYDEFGYEKVNKYIIEIADEKEIVIEQEAKKEEQEDE